jgi:hypothetical protein
MPARVHTALKACWYPAALVWGLGLGLFVENARRGRDSASAVWTHDRRVDKGTIGLIAHHSHCTHVFSSGLCGVSICSAVKRIIKITANGLTFFRSWA